MNQNDRLDYLLAYLVAESPESYSIATHGSLEDKRHAYRAMVNLRPPMLTSDAYLKIQDEYLQQELAARGVIDVEELPASLNDDRLALWRGDISRLQIDAIVNAANNQLLGCFHPCHGCIDNAIHTAAGIQLRQACQEIMAAQGYLEPTGGAKITPGFNLPAKYILHTVGPITNGNVSDEECRALVACYSSCLRLADAHDLRTLAFCCIATGEYGFPKDRAAGIAVQAVREYLDAHESALEKVVFNVYTDEDEALYGNILGIH